MTEEVRVRFPPSPTGFCHIGTARTALLNYLFARKTKGKLIMRIEDTDRERSKKEYEDDILECTRWLGLAWDEFYRQSERADIYAAALRKLLDTDTAYISEEESKKEAGARVQVVRLRNPGKQVTFRDMLRGDITFDTTELKDFAIARGERDPLYHFAVVVDDAAMAISHVIRGEDHISNTPRQILIQEALGIPRPQYAHFPLNLAADRSKLSKRKGDVSVRSYRERGFLPQALLNYLAVLGWTPPSGREFLTLEEMAAEFDLQDMHTSGAIFDAEKLRWFNRHYLLEMEDAEFGTAALSQLRNALQERNTPWSEAAGKRLLPLIRERISAFEDIKTLAAEGEFDYFFSPPALDRNSIPQKGDAVENAGKHLAAVRNMLQAAPEEDFADPARLKAVVWDYATAEGRGSVLWPLRYALTGRPRSPDPFEVSSILGKDATLERLDAARKIIETP